MNKVSISAIFDRKKEATKTKSATIYLEVRANQKERRFISTSIKVFKGQFKAGRVVGREDADLLNRRINDRMSEIHQLVSRMDERGQIFTVAMIDSLNSAPSSPSFLDFMECRINERPLRDNTKRQHRKVLNFLRTEYTHIRTFDDITVSAIVRLDDYLHRRTLPSGEKMCQTSIHSYHRVLKHYIREAVMLEFTTNNPYTKWSSQVGQSRQRVILTMEEVNAIRSHLTRSTLMAKVRDLFIVQCFTGMAYADLMATDFSTAEAHDGKLVLPMATRYKTGTPFSLVLLPPVVEILNRYNGQLPHISYNLYNRYLKALATACGIQKTVTTHIGRHTFATTIALGAGVPIEVVSKILGHTDIKTTQIYAKIMPQQILDGFSSIAEKIS
jgi:site-specific recombinase XerD